MRRKDTSGAKLEDGKRRNNGAYEKGYKAVRRSGEGKIVVGVEERDKRNSNYILSWALPILTKVNTRKR